jgi:hypothetical protein
MTKHPLPATGGSFVRDPRTGALRPDTPAAAPRQAPGKRAPVTRRRAAPAPATTPAED